MTGPNRHPSSWSTSTVRRSGKFRCRPAAGTCTSAIGSDSLDLKHTHVTDAGLAHLNGLTKLSVLDLERTPITDAALAHLNELTKLRSIDLTGTQVTQSGVRELQKALPNAQIVP